ncbi:MAG: adenylate kinase [Phycisphaerae bacterium]|nr:adenylate kinase [Phycisphaerae bacterium]
MRVVLLGPPGAGKGTQAARLAEALRVVHLSSGDILRAERAARTRLGQEAQRYMDSGALVPDEVVLEMMAGRMQSSDAEAGFVLDGFPRTIPQAEGLDRRLEAAHRPIDRVVNIEVSDEVVTPRLTGRWSCPKDGRVYHEQYSPPKSAGTCDICGTALVRRRDDEPSVVRQRLATYHAETKPLIDYYRRRGVLASVNGDGEIDVVFESIRAACRGSG